MKPWLLVVAVLFACKREDKPAAKPDKEDDTTVDESDFSMSKLIHKPKPAEAVVPTDIATLLPEVKNDSFLPANEALVVVSRGICTKPDLEPIHHTAADYEGGLLWGTSCGDTGKYVIGVVRTGPGRDPEVLVAGVIESSFVRVDRILTSDKRVCAEYNRIDAFSASKRIRICGPKGGSKDVPIIKPISPPTGELATWDLTPGDIDAASASLTTASPHCRDAIKKGPVASKGVKEDDRKYIAIGCGDAEAHKYIVGLAAIGSTGTRMLSYTMDLDTDDIVIDRVRANPDLMCVDYTRAPSKEKSQLCVARYKD